MNLPNKLTILRIIMIPFFAVILLTQCFGASSDWIALAIFIVASLTDLLDGKIARKYNLVTNFGKFADPLADKLLVCTGLIIMIELGRISAWIVAIIVAREFIISGFRIIAADKGVVIAASKVAKYKTTVQIIMVCFLVADIDYAAVTTFTTIIIVLAVVLTIVSLIEYIYVNRNVLKDTK